jgi:hypothetical protein
LEPARETTTAVIDIDIQPENKELKYKVEEIKSTRTNKGQQKYLIKWEGYLESENI